MRQAWFSMLLMTCAISTAKRAHAESARFAWPGPDCSTSVALFQSRLEKLVDAKDLPRLAGSVAVARKGAEWSVEVAIELDGAHLGRRRFAARLRYSFISLYTR